ncbi:SLBB domain-containing protein [Acetobacteraceae bacterium H6797]|nr:SLBB domain-containing protein [Acetobacteraceae bacterium H6797]
MAIPGVAAAQQAAPISPPALPSALSPGLPSTLPNGVPLPSVSAQTQQDILQRILDASGGRMPASVNALINGGSLPSPAAPMPGAPALPQAAPAAPALTPHQAAQMVEPYSNTENFFAGRLEQPLRQFGYDTFRSMQGAAPGPLIGGLPDDYVLGRDDEVQVSIRGRTRQSLTLRINRDGQLVLPDLAPIDAAGRRLDDLRAELANRIGRELGGSEVYLSISQTRQIAIFVAGEVMRPGPQPLPALTNLLDALAAAGGVKKTGSLRAIRIDGPRGSRVVDLYPVIAGVGDPPELMLREGERVVVPPLGGVVAIGGEVTRPAIYELPARAISAPLGSLLRLAGEPLRPSGNRFLLQGTDGEGRRSFGEIGLGQALRRGDAVLVQAVADVAANQIRLAGHVAMPLTRASTGRVSLRGLLSDSRLVKADPYVRMAVIWRLDSQTRVRSFLPFDLGRVLQGKADQPLAEGDEVIILSQADLLWLASPPVQRALRGDLSNPVLPGMTASAPPVECPALQALAVAARASPQRFAHARGAGFPDIGAPPCPQSFIDYPALLPFLLDNAVLLTGEVRLPGLYPILEDTGMDQVLAAAGGPADTADLSAVELTREPQDQAGAIPLNRLLMDLRSRNFAAVRLSPRDALRVPRGFGDRDIGPVTLVGEFVRPGVYDIRRGEKFSEVIARAGGLTPQAYPYGAVFTRESVRQRQQDGFARTARELENSLIQVAAGQAVAGSRSGGIDLGSAITAGRELAGSLREARAAGRMTVEANPVILAAKPELDVLLEPGDLIAIPKRPNEVTVVGSVLNPGSLQFNSGWRAERYVNAAGGTQRFADPTRAFVVLPNGQSVPAGIGAWQQGGPPVPPGSLVVVPQDPSPFETWGFIRDITQVLSQVSISAASLAVISKASSN